MFFSLLFSLKLIRESWRYIALTIVLNVFYSSLQLRVTSWFAEIYNLFVKSFNSNERDLTILREIKERMFLLPAFLVMLSFLRVSNSFFLVKIMLIWRRIKTRNFFNNWINIRENEGVSQRVQEDTIRVVKLVESLYFKIVMSVIRAVTHIPVIIHLSKEVGGIPPFPSDSKYSLIIYMILALFVSVFLVYLTSKDLSFKIVEKEIKEASFRKKLIIGEDQEFIFNTSSMSSILDDITLIHKEIYIYLFKYDLTSGFLREIIQFLPTILLVPSIIKGSISIGSRAAIIRCFDTVRTGITCIIFNWDEISELIAAAGRISLLESLLLKHKLNQNKDENEHKIPLLA